MEKRVQLSSNFAPEKEDQISKLPDDILVYILCLLKVKEATRTSVLSSRWRHLWTFTGRLDFDYLLVRGVVEMSPSESSLREKVRLSLSFSVGLTHLKVSGESLKLKYLEIMRCYNLGYIEISETNLVSLTSLGYIGSPETNLDSFTCFDLSTNMISVSVYNVPSLVEASLAGFYAGFCIKSFCQFSFVSQLEKLMLDLRGQKFESSLEFPKLRNLGRLELTLNANSVDSILHCISLLNVSPSLQRFSVKFTNYLFGLKDCERQRITKVRKENCPHQCLKVVELVDFVGCPIEIALFLLEKAVSLKKLLIHPCSTYVDEWGRRCYNLETNSRAKQLLTSLPPGAELVIL